MMMMIQRIKQAPLFCWLIDEMAPVLLRRRILMTAGIFSILAAVYWVVIASDRYVSEAHVVVDRTDMASGQVMDFAALLGAPGSNRTDQLLLRDHLLSIDMMKKLDKSLNLRAHYSDTNRDIISRMWSEDLTLEWFYRYYQSRVLVEYDDYAGILKIKASAFDPDMAHAITSMLVKDGERFMNETAHRLAEDQVAFLEHQVLEMNQRVIKARDAVINFQNQKGLVSPLSTTENIATIIAKLEADRTSIETQRSASLAYLVADHPMIIQMGQQLAAIDKQIKSERAKLTSANGKTLNRTVEEYQRLEMEAGFAQDVYKTALVALEQGRIEATRNLKKISVLQEPVMPEYPMEPYRYYNTLVFWLVSMLLAGVAHLLVAIVRDHKD